MTKRREDEAREGACRICIVVSEFNNLVTEQLLRGTLARLAERGVSSRSATVVRVPGSWELPQAAARVLRSKRHDAVIAIGCVIRGETAHFDLVARAANDQLARLAVASDIPVVFGVLATDSYDQAAERADPRRLNRGAELANAALDMIALSL